jgi:hypothetical protein
LEEKEAVRLLLQQIDVQENNNKEKTRNAIVAFKKNYLYDYSRVSGRATAITG